MAAVTVRTASSPMPVVTATHAATDQPLRPAAYGGGRVIEGATRHRLIYFTFDDGPDRRNTPLLLDRLDAVGVKATFFLTASRIAGRNTMEREQAELAREIVARGHSIGNHTFDHRQLPLLSDADALEQVTHAEDVFEDVLGFHPLLVRPPGGARSPRIDELLAQRGYTTVLWNLGADDFVVKSAEELTESFTSLLDRREREHRDRGGVVLLHDTNAWSVDAFQLIYAELAARNCRMLASGEELYDIVPDLRFFYQPRDGAPASLPAAPAEPPEAELATRQANLRRETARRCAAAEGN
jgi:peptidoglycan/xylan/chitin deacetylase (PgdA/CDA1 family)